MQTRNMIKIAATSTDVRKQKIMDILKKIDHNKTPTIQQFGFSVGNEFETVPARILDPPGLEYANKKLIRPDKGQWRTDGCQFLRSENMDNWAFLIADNRVRDNEIHGFAKEVKNKYTFFVIQVIR